ncbi:MAG: aminotransferase class I/II-fold pyridoxal phosphate-dependent enzyme [Clostridia bacterium]|nr:aminotransferase class I/II-fold pyridoxal phosphate-dependent enzyme [Clostridia bacterium]
MDYDKYFSKKAKEIKPSGIRKFFDIVRKNENAISLGVGEPDFDTPWSGRNFAMNAIRKGYTHYTSNWGLDELRELISRFYNTKYNLEYDPKNEVIVTIGASEAVDMTLRGFINPGDEVLVLDPSYVSYAPCVELQSGVAIPIPCEKETEFKVTPENLKKCITGKTKAIILSYPNNPTGATMNKEDYELIAPLIIENDLIVISDEIYSELTYEGVHVSPANIAGLKERTVVINGFSKFFAMTGWRLGYLLAPKEICSVLIKIHQYAIMCAPTISQYAGVACLKDCFENDFSVINDMRDEYDMRRRYLVNELEDMGFKCIPPRGAFYVFASVESFGMDGDEFAQKLLDSEWVAVVPGSAFGKSGKNFVRISYAYSIKDIEKALERIRKFIEKIK